MNLREIEEKIKGCEIVTDIYSGNYICRCGKRLSFAELRLGGFGYSVACSCGNVFWLTSDDEGTEELLIYEGFDYFWEDDFTIVKQRVYAGINWQNLKLYEKRLKEERELLKIRFPERSGSRESLERKLTFEYEDSGNFKEDKGRVFFSNFAMEDMEKLSVQLEKFCTDKGILPNYGTLLRSLIFGSNIFKLEEIFNALAQEPYIELFIKAGLDYLFNQNLLFNLELLERNINIYKSGTTASKILGVPKRIVNYISEYRLNLSNISALQNFFQECNIRDFEILISGEDCIFSLRDLGDLKRLLLEGCSSHRLNSYAREIIEEEHMDKSEFLMLLRDCIRMSKTAGLEFKIYGKNLRERHDELIKKYKLIRNEALNNSLSQIGRKTEIRQYGREYTAMVPASVYDFEVEAKNQKHCVLSYVEDMAAGDTLIVFIRPLEEPNKSHITLEIKNRRVIQAKRFANGAIDEEDRTYLEKLSAANGWLFYL